MSTNRVNFIEKMRVMKNHAFTDIDKDIEEQASAILMSWSIRSIDDADKNNRQNK